MSVQNNWYHRMMRGEVARAAVMDLLNERIIELSLEQGRLRLCVQAKTEFCNPAGGVQGGMLSAVLDSVTAGLVDATLAPGHVPVTLSLNVQFLSGAKPGEIIAEARITKRGRDTCFVQGDLHQNGQHIATAQAVLKILELQTAAAQSQ